MVILAQPIFADLKYERVEPALGPTDHAILLRVIGSLVLVVRMEEHLLRFLETDATLGIFS